MYRVLLLLWMLLFPSLGWAQSASDDELALLHRPLGSSPFARLRIWDRSQAAWRKPTISETPNPQAKVTVLHLWAEWCRPCVEEFPKWRELLPLLQKAHGDEVAIVFVSESSSLVEFGRFLDENRGRLPQVALYHDTGEALSESLRSYLASANLSLPLTLLLDDKRVIRYAVSGSMQHRFRQVLSLVPRLLKLSMATPPPAQGTP
jgi:thiol-disulfide isomerase/thioredoxin